MKKMISPAIAIFTVSASLFQSGSGFSKNAPETDILAGAGMNEKVTICHREGNGSSHAITVSIHAVPAHLAHGDAIGDCGGGSSSAEQQ